jgi:glutamine amidotransferase PdxT
MKIIIIPLKDEFARKLILLHGLKAWVQNIVYQRANILNTCQGLMKLAEYMEDDGLCSTMVSSEAWSPKRTM